MAHNTQHNNASFHKAPISIWAMVEKELGTVTWRRKGLLSVIVARDCPPEPRCPLPGVVSHRKPAACWRGSGVQPGSGRRQPRATTPGNNPGQQPRATIPSSRFSLYLILMWKYQRRLTTRRSRLRFIISTAGANRF